MRADDGELDRRAGARGRALRRLPAAGRSGRAERHARGAHATRAPSEARRASPPAGAISVTPAGQAVGAERPGHGEGAEVEQVDEVRVGAELGVRADRIGVEIGERARARRGRHGEHVDRRASIGSDARRSAASR